MILNATRTGITVILGIYLVALAFFLSAMGETINNINYTTTEQKFGIPINFLGMEFKVFGGFFGNIVLSINDIPLWANMIFIVIPSILFITFSVLMFIPTIPSG